MNKKINLEEIQNRIDFESVNQKLDALIATGGLKCRKKISDLLDRVKPALLRARESKVSLQSLTEFLNSSGIPVSEPTLRQYLNLEKGAKRRVSRSRKQSAKTVSPPAVKTVAPALVSEASTRKLPPRLARRQQKSG
jgi:hypothetical protein